MVRAVIGELRTTTGQETGSLPRLNERDRRKGAAPGSTSAPGCYLAIESGDDVVNLPLTGEVTRLGRSLSADVHLDDATVSRRHAMVVEREGAYVLLDDRSMNGTWLNGERVSEALLADGDVIQLGAVRLRYLDVPDAPPAA